MAMDPILKEMLKETEENEALGRIFYQYVEKSDIAKKMLSELISKKYSRKQSKKGFFIAENERNKIGIISHCLGLESLALSTNFEYDLFSDDDKKVEEIKVIFIDTLKAIFASIDLTQEKVDLILGGKGDDVTLNYDASPCVFNDDIDDESLQVKGYVDTMAKLLETFSEFRIFTYSLIDQHGFKFELEGVDDIVRWNDAVIIKTIKDLNKACISQPEQVPYFIEKKEKKDKFGEGMLFKGWNYIAMGNEAEPSLYFTYAVCSAYTSFISKLPYVLAGVRNAEKQYDIARLKKKIIPELPIGNKNIKMSRNYELLKLCYADYVDFNKRCVDAGHYIDYSINQKKIDMTQAFVGQGYNEVSTDEIINSTTNDAMINTLLSILSMIYAGVDLDYASVGKGEDFTERLQYAVQNTLKVYKKLERLNKNYIVDQYFLSFNEFIPAEHQEQAKLLRKQRILMVTLMPLLIKTYTAMARYIIEYPQKEMRDYLKIILSNRCIDKYTGNALWIWDKDGYNLSVNLIYLLNMLSFYTYYEKYEYPFTNDTDSYAARLEKQEREHEAQLADIENTHAQEVKELRANLKRAQNALLEPKPVEKEIIVIVEAFLKEKLGKLIAETFKKSRESTIDSGRDELAKAFQGMFIAMFAGEGLREMVDVGSVSAVDGKLSTNMEYISNENAMFDLFSQWMIDRVRKEMGK